MASGQIDAARAERWESSRCCASLADTGDAFQGLLDAYPPELMAIFGITDPDSLLTGAGLVSSRVYQGVGLVSVLLGSGDGTLPARQTFAVGNRPFSEAVADLNNDGAPDLVTANYGSNNVSVLLHQ